MRTQYQNISPEIKLAYPANFFNWLKDNRHIYDEFVRRALQMKRSGRERFAAKCIIEVIRWNTSLKSSEEDFKINNNYAPGLARLAMAEHKELEGFFQLKS